MIPLLIVMELVYPLAFLTTFLAFWRALLSVDRKSDQEAPSVAIFQVMLPLLVIAVLAYIDAFTKFREEQRISRRPRPYPLRRSP